MIIAIIWNVFTQILQGTFLVHDKPSNLVQLSRISMHIYLIFDNKICDYKLEVFDDYNNGGLV